MKIKVEGHKYELDNFENKEKEGQTLQFIQKELVGSDQYLVTVADGTTNEDVLEVLINRMEYLQGKFPCKENEYAISNLQQALIWLNERTKNRVQRGVEGKHLA
jgi:hypothetical protein